MKFIFTSDKFGYIHPTLSPRKTNDYSKKELLEAEKNTNKVVFDEKTLNAARTASGNTIPSSQYGVMIVLPETKSGNRKVLGKFIREVFANSVCKLNSEYSDKTDPIVHFKVDSSGKMFKAKFTNSSRGLDERFSNKSVSIYVAGCKHMTAEYLFEEFIDRCYEESSSRDKRTVKEHLGLDNTPESELVNFKQFHSFLVFDFQNRQFHQIGISERELYYAKSRNARSSRDNYDIREFPIDVLTSNGKYDIL